MTVSLTKCRMFSGERDDVSPWELRHHPHLSPPLRDISFSRSEVALDWRDVPWGGGSEAGIVLQWVGYGWCCKAFGNASKTAGRVFYGPTKAIDIVITEGWSIVTEGWSIVTEALKWRKINKILVGVKSIRYSWCRLDLEIRGNSLQEDKFT